MVEKKKEKREKVHEEELDKLYMHCIYIYTVTQKTKYMPIHCTCTVYIHLYLCSIFLLSISSQAVQLLAVELGCPAVVLLMSLLCCAAMLPEVRSLGRRYIHVHTCTYTCTIIINVQCNVWIVGHTPGHVHVHGYEAHTVCTMYMYMYNMYMYIHVHGHVGYMFCTIDIAIFGPCSCTCMYMYL